VTKRIEELLNAIKETPSIAGKIENKDLLAPYLKAVSSFVDLKLIKRKHLKVITDPMHGAAIGYISSIFNKSKCKVIEIHSKADPNFGGLHPEPIEDYLFDLKKAVKQNGAAIGLATDGDADRLGSLMKQVVIIRRTWFSLFYSIIYANTKV